MTGILCIDFDDTVVMGNVMREVLGRFAGPGWRDLEASYHRGEMTVEQFNARAFELIGSTTAGEIAEFVRTVAVPRPGFAELYDWAHWHGWQVAIVSNGLDLYIDPVLRDLGLERVVRHAGRARYIYKWQVRYLSPRGIEIEDGFKVSYVSAFRAAGDFVVYAGDGASDVEAANLSDVAFARSTLWDQLGDSHRSIFPFETFDDVRVVLEREAEGWLARAALA